MAISGTLTVGMLMAVRMLRLHAERLSDIVLAEPEALGSHAPIQAACERKPPTIAPDNVSFRYGSGTSWVLRHVSIEIGAGEHVAIVGATGCGKTTLAKIVPGLLEPTEGTVRIDGVPLNQFGLGNWRRPIAAVMQDDPLFSASLQENIAGFDESIDQERVQAAASLAARNSAFCWPAPCIGRLAS